MAGSIDLRWIRFDKLNLPQPGTPRRRRGLGALRRSIEQVGVLVPLCVRPLGRGEYAVVMGEGRLEALREMGVAASHRVPCVVQTRDDRAAALAALVENSVREPLSPLDEAELARTLTGEYGYTQEEVGRAIGRDQGTVSRLLAVFQLDPRVLRALHEGTIEWQIALELLRAGEDRALQRRILGEALDRGLNATEVGALVRWHLDRARFFKPARFAVAGAGRADLRSTRSGRLRFVLEADDQAGMRKLIDTVRKKYV